MIEFLQQRQNQFENVNQNIDVHISRLEALEYQRLAKIIDNERYFTIYGCVKCTNELIKFVFNNQDKLEQPEEVKTEKPKRNGKA